MTVDMEMKNGTKFLQQIPVVLQYTKRGRSRKFKEIDLSQSYWSRWLVLRSNIA